MLHTQALTGAIAGGRGELVAQIRAARGRLLSTMGKAQEAVADMELARADFVRAGDQASLARVLNDLAIEVAQGGDLAAAERMFEAALVATRAASPSNRGPRFLDNLGIIALQRGRPDLAVPRFEEAVAILRENGRPAALGFALNSYATALFDLGRPAAADRALSEAIELLRQADSEDLEAALLLRGRVDVAGGRLAGVEALAEEMDTAAKATGETEPLAGAEMMRGELAFARGELDAARPHFREASRLYLATATSDAAVEIDLELSELERQAGNPAESARLAEAAIGPLRGRGERADLVAGEAVLARIDAEGDRAAEARRRLAGLDPKLENSPSLRLRRVFR